MMYHLNEQPLASACSCRVAPVHIWPPAMAHFEIVSMCTCMLKATAAGDEMVGLPSELVRAQHAVVLLPGLPDHLYVNVLIYNVPSPPT